MSREKSALICGLREVLRVLRKGTCNKLYVALDADAYVTRPAVSLALRSGIEIVDISDMKTLGKLAGITTGSALAAEVKKPLEKEVK